MARFVVCAMVLAVVPMIMLNAIGRDAFLGYYLGVIAMWVVFVLAAKRQVAASTDTLRDT
jgi:hypothetical protein